MNDPGPRWSCFDTNNQKYIIGPKKSIFEAHDKKGRYVQSTQQILAHERPKNPKVL